jgi:hypothetical protein
MQTVQGNNKKRKGMIASWACPISSNDKFIDMKLAGDDDADDDKIVLKGPNPYSLAKRDSEEVQQWIETRQFFLETTIPHMFAANTFLECDGSSLSARSESALRVDVTLFRRDTMQSVRILENSMFSNEGGLYELSVTDTEFSYELNGEIGEVKFGVNNAGNVARIMMYESRVFSDLNVKARFTLSSKLPAPGSNDEPAWLANCRQQFLEDESYRPVPNDLEALASIAHFEFQVTGFYILLARWKEQEGSWLTKFKSPNELMILLEGLRWA